jgi:hypothetical protein
MDIKKLVTIFISHAKHSYNPDNFNDLIKIFKSQYPELDFDKIIKEESDPLCFNK